MPYELNNIEYPFKMACKLPQKHLCKCAWWRNVIGSIECCKKHILIKVNRFPLWQTWNICFLAVVIVVADIIAALLSVWFSSFSNTKCCMKVHSFAFQTSWLNIGKSEQREHAILCIDACDLFVASFWNNISFYGIQFRFDWDWCVELRLTFSCFHLLQNY